MTGFSIRQKFCLLGAGILLVLYTASGAFGQEKREADSGRVLRPAAGADLADITVNAKDGDTIVLGPGNYQGQIVVEKKTLLVRGDPGGKTVLTGGKDDLLIYVGDDARLLLQNVVLNAGGQTKVALHVERGAALILGCTTTGSSLAGFYVDGGSLLVRQSRFTGIPRDAIIAKRQSKCEVYDSRFDSIGGHGIAGVEAASVIVSRSAFDRIKSIAVSLEGVPQCEILDCDFRNALQAVVVRHAMSVTIDGNRMSGAGANQYAIGVDTAYRAIVSNNIVTGANGGISVMGQFRSPPLVSGNTVLDAKHHALGVAVTSAEGDASVEIKGNRLISTVGGKGLLLSKTPKAVLLDNTILTNADYAVFVHDGAAARFRGNVIAASKQAVHLHGTSTFAPYGLHDDVLIGSEGQDESDLDEVGVAVARRIADEAVQKRMKTLVAAAVAASTAGASNLEPLDSAVKELKSEAARQRTAAARLALPGGAQSVAPPERAIAARADSNPSKLQIAEAQTGRQIVPNTASEGPLGFHLVYYDDEGARAAVQQPLELKDPQAMRKVLAQIRHPEHPSDSYWRFSMSGALRPEATAEQVDQSRRMARAALSEIDERVAQMRKKRRAMTNSQRGATSMQHSVAQNRLSKIHLMACRILAVTGDADDARRVLAELTDVYPFIIQPRVALAAYIENRLGILPNGAVVSTLENSDGILQLAAAEYLHRYGFHIGDGVLLDHLRHGRGLGRVRIARLLYDRGDAEVLGAMRAVFRECMAEKARVDEQHGRDNGKGIPYYDDAEIATTVGLYLLAHGNDAERNAVSQWNFNSDDIDVLFYLVRDPRPLVHFNLGLTEGPRLLYNYDIVARSLPLLRDLPAGDRKQFAGDFDRALEQVAIKQNVMGMGEKENRLAAQFSLGIAKSDCQPNYWAAEKVFKRVDKWLKWEGTWIPRNWALPRLVEDYFGDRVRVSSAFFDYVSHDQLETALKEASVDPSDLRVKLLLAYHLIRLFDFH